MSPSEALRIQSAVVTLLKQRFPNLTVDETLTLASSIVLAVVTILDDASR